MEKFGATEVFRGIEIDWSLALLPEVDPLSFGGENDQIKFNLDRDFFPGGIGDGAVGNPAYVSRSITSFHTFPGEGEIILSVRVITRERLVREGNEKPDFYELFSIQGKLHP